MDKSKQHRSLAWALCVAVLCIAPFLNKPFHLDDPFYVWTAQQIQKAPLNPFGYSMNWYGSEQPAFQIAFAPPLFSYLLALWGSVAGLGEVSCHAFNLIVALVVTTGIFFLAEEWKCDPFVATVISVVSPLFIMSATSVMCDLSMLAFWIWAFVIWLKALRTRSIFLFLMASVLACACVLTKFNGALVLILMGLASVLSRGRLERHLLWLGLPCLAVVIYSWWLTVLYKTNLFGNIFSFIGDNRSATAVMVFQSAVGSLTFAGAVVAAVFPFLFISLRRKEFIGLVALSVLVEGVFWKMREPRPALWVVQHTFWMLGGLALLWVGIRQAVIHRDKVGMMLLGWLALAFIFPTFLNWGISGRSLVALIPIIGLIAVRIHPQVAGLPPRKVLLYLLPMGLCSLTVASADFEMASINKKVAGAIASQLHEADSHNRTLWFEGHWGFQYYMQALGATPLDILNSKVKPGDLLILPINNADVTPPKPGRLLLYKKISMPYSFPVSVMNKSAGAGYHSYYWGGLPYVFGLISHEDFYVLMFPSAQHGLGLNDSNF